MPKFTKRYYVMRDVQGFSVIWLAGIRPVDPAPYAGPYATAAKANKIGSEAAKFWGDFFRPATVTEET